MTVATCFAVTAVATTAHAAALTATRSGSYVFTDSARHAFSVRDTVCDSQFAAGDYRATDGSGGRLTEQRGCSYTTTETVVHNPVTITNVRACRSNTATPVSCGAWAVE